MQEIQNTFAYILIAFLVCAVIEGVKQWYLNENVQTSVQETYQASLWYLQMLTLTLCGFGVVASLLSMPFVWSFGTSTTLVATLHVFLRICCRRLDLNPESKA